ncbi:trypsin-like peptidase domain-containing protein [Carboxylicivirga mesophila]|uniref:Serine protease n=1 Tax=Carboxylicivirga mesophila TaxID=1166478 RepID=A0ABS5KAA5_9BACT|nr:serine protease [Carboxylicivirga mesophila]MBS2211894.1 trypsin-like peptidase domain-containing protein [Carboxylicivirga mesophila]
MTKKIKQYLAGLMVICFSALTLSAQEKTVEDYGNYINDKEVTSRITQEAGELFDNGSFTGLFKLRQEMDRYKKTAVIYNEEKLAKKATFSFDEHKEGVLILAKLYLCDKCPNYHISTATGFVINKDGVGVTNHHVFKKSDNNSTMHLSVYAVDYEGNVYPVKRVLAGDELSDLALFKIDTSNELKPLRLGDDLNVGDDLHLISHPDKRFYYYSHGRMMRQHTSNKYKSPRQSISADFAKGSSGGPVFNAQGEVVGIVTTTNSIYYTPNQNLQMVVKDVIPVSLLKNMIQKDMVTTSIYKGVPEQ